MTEYIIVLVSVAVVVLVIGVAFGGRIQGFFMGANDSIGQLDSEGREITNAQLNASQENSLEGAGSSEGTRVTVDGDGNASGGGAHGGKSVGMAGADGGPQGEGQGGGFPIKEIILMALLIVVVIGGARAVAGGSKA